MRSQSGFTLLELMVVMAIIAILAGLAMVQLNEYKKNTLDASAASDLRNVMGAQEAYYIDNETYVADMNELEAFDTGSPAVTTVLEADSESYKASSYHPEGLHTYCFDSAADEGIVKLDGTAQDCP